MPFRLGGDGSDGTIDCIHLVYHVLADMGIPTPTLQPEWYGYPTVPICRALLNWGGRVEKPAYDGDVVLLEGDTVAFGVVWQRGILCAVQISGRVGWFPIEALPIQATFRHCSRLSAS